MPIMENSVDRTYERMRAKLRDVVPDFELRAKAELVHEILRIKRERGAVILGHNYMEPALFHFVPDHVGDSLELSRKAARVAGDPVIFCGVRFMAETAKILSPGKTVLIPSPEAGCSLASSITSEDVRGLRRRFPGVPLVSYVNTSAEVKAESDVCCTSGNAAAVVESLGEQGVLLIPDEYLAANVARETGRKLVFPEALDGGRADLSGVVIGWHGRCEVHEQFTVDDVRRVREQFPDVAVLAHPECPPQVVEAADFSGSTAGMIEFVRESAKSRYLMLTECSMGDNVAAEYPDKEMLRLCSVRCPHMNEITLEQTLASLRENRYEVEVPPDIARRARGAIERMLRSGVAAGAGGVRS